MNMNTRRNILGSIAGAVLLYPFIASCKGKLFMRNEVVVSVVLYSYLNRPIFDVLLNGSDIGLANAYGGGGIMTGETLTFGAQTLTWRLGGPEGAPRNGETVTAKNSLVITKEQVAPNVRYLGVHIYPDDTAELIFSEHLSDISPRGEEIIEEVRKHDRK